MKKITVLFALLAAFTFASAQTVPLTVVFKFMNIVDGYDHDCKAVVFIDGEQVGESGTVKESKGQSFTVQVPSGKHDLKITNMALYEGNWEEHSIENNYSIDCEVNEPNHSFKSKNKFFIIYDIDTQAYTAWKKAPKLPKKDKSAG